MLTTRENLLETIHGGHPDRFVNQYEYLAMVPDPIFMGILGKETLQPGGQVVNGFGVTMCWKEGTPGPFPLSEGEEKVLKDITQWKETVKLAPTEYPDEAWVPFEEMAAKIDRKEKFVTAMCMPGIFEKLHYFMGMADTMVNFYEEPEAMHEFIDFLADYEIACAKEVCKHLHPDALFHHDDWGSQRSSFLSPSMFEEFILPAYKKVYGFWKANGVQIITHHSDSYGANLIPYMIEMGIDIWQGAVYENDIPAVLKEYGGKISLQAGLDNGKYDKADWTKESIHNALRDLFDTAGTKYLIPSFTMGGEGTTYPGAYDCATEEIKQLSKEYFRA